MQVRNIPTSTVPSVNSSILSDGRSREIRLIDAGLDRLDHIRVPLQLANLHRLLVFHLHELCELIRDVGLALVLQALENRVDQVVTTCLHVSQQFGSTNEFLARTLRRARARIPSPRWDPHRPVQPKLCSGPSTCIGRRMPRTTSCTASSCSCHCHCAPARPARCGPRVGIGGSEGTHTAVWPLPAIGPAHDRVAQCSCADRPPASLLLAILQLLHHPGI